MSKQTDVGRIVNKGIHKRRVVATSWSIDDDPELETFWQSLKGTNQLSAELRRLIKLGLEVDQQRSSQQVTKFLQEIRDKLLVVGEIDRQLDRIERGIAGYHRSEEPVEYKTAADDEGVDVSELSDGALGNILNIG